MRHLALLVGGSMFVLGCSDPGASPTTSRLPALFYFTAEANSGDTISCHLAYIYQVTSEREAGLAVEYIGNFGGEAYRAHLAPDGSGEAFWADVGGEFLVKLLPGDSIELGYLRILPTGESRFWDRQALFAGRMGETALASGTWSCEPLDVRSDTTGIVAGTWTIQATPPGACESCIP